MSQDPKTLLDLELDGALDAAGRKALVAAASPEIESERRQLEALHRQLAAGRVVARAGFKARVMDALPVAAWEARGHRAWRLPFAVMAALAALGSFLMGLEGSRIEGSMLAAAGTVVEFAITTTLGGAGLLSASWRGLGLGLGEALALPQLALFGVGVLAMNLLLLTLLRRRRGGPATQPVRQGR